MNVVWCLTQARRHLWDQWHKAQTQRTSNTSSEQDGPVDPSHPGQDWHPYRQWYRQHPQLQRASRLDVIMQWWLSHNPSSSSHWFHPAWTALGIGVILGSLAMVGLLSFAYPSPINVFYWLGMFIFLPWILMIAVTAAKRWWKSKPQRWRPMPSLQVEKGLAVPSFVGSANEDDRRRPVFWQAWLLSSWRHLPDRLLPSMLFLLNQCMALGYLLGGLVVFSSLLLMQDLAFGWASTLTLSNQAVENFVHWISWPWNAWWDSAVPSADVIAQTRFYRLSPQLEGDYHYGEWWHFLMAALFFYGLLPRATIWWFANRRFQRQVLRACDQDSVLSAFYRFLTMPQLDTGSEEVTQQNPDADLIEQFTDHLNCLSVEEFKGQLLGKEVILWGNHSAESLLYPYPQAILTLLGADRSYGEDLDAVEALLAREPNEVIWLASGWEPPTAELQDFSSMVPAAITQKVLLFSAEQCPVDESSWQHFVDRRMPNARLSGQIAQEVL